MRKVTFLLATTLLLFSLSPVATAFNFENLFRIQDLDNVVITSPMNNQTLFYNASSGLWYNTNFSSTTSTTSPLTTKGDIYTHNGSDNTRIGVGSDGQVLTAKSSEPTGLAWQTPTTYIGGSGNQYYIPMFSSTSTLTNSVMYQLSNKIGIGGSPDGKLHVIDASYPVMAVERTTTVGSTGDLAGTTGLASSMMLRTHTSVSAVDGFGGGFIFSLEDSSGVPYNAARIYARRDGADNLAALQFWTGTDGLTPQMTLRSDGDFGIGTVNPSEKLEVSGNIKIPVNSRMYFGSSYITDLSSQLNIQSSTGKDIYLTPGGSLEAVFYSSGGSYFINDATFIKDIIVGDNVTIGDDLNLSRTLYYDNYYAEGYFHNHTDPLEITISTQSTFYNLTNWTAGEYNGFVFEGDGVTANVSGTYKLDGYISFSGGNGGEYDFTVFINGIEEMSCDVSRTTSSTTIGNVGGPSCLISISEGDHIHLGVEDLASPTQNIEIENMNFHIHRIGN